MEETGWFTGEFIETHYEIARRFVELSYERDPEGTRALFELAGQQVIDQTVQELLDEGTVEMWGLDEDGEVLYGLTEQGEAIAAAYSAVNEEGL